MTKMTEETIIDGINVWSCKHYDLENNYCDQSYLGEGGLLKNTKNPKRCECSPNCHYKQLRRLEQERDELKKACEKCKLFDIEKTNRDLLEQIDKLEQENKELIEDNLNLSKENKELKEELKPYKHPDVVTLLTNWRTGELDRIHNKIANERDTYRSALEEIQKVIKSYDLAVDNGVSVDTLYTIRKIINEVLNESD